ncbi:hypothetical protein LCGC14_2928180, partial [marine sediment metagenome]
WGAIPERTQVDLPATRQAYADDLAKRNEASDPNDIPDFVKKFLGKDGLFEQPQEIRTVLTFRGRLLDEIAAARTTGGLTREKKRLLNALQTSIIDKDLSALAGQVDDETKAAVDLARQYSVDFNDRFTRGPVADLLGRTRDRGVRTAEGLTLEVSVGRGGPVGREEVDALVGAMEFSGDLPAMQTAIEVYLKDAFKRKAVEGGRILKNQAKAFMKQFDDVLDRYPELKQDFEGAIQADNAAILAERRLANVTKGLDDPRVSRAAIFLKAPVDKELDAVMRSNNPAITMKELVNQAGRDPSGQALEGLKTGFGDWLLRNAQSGVADANGEFFVSGKRLMKLLRTPQVEKSMLPLLNGRERGRLMRAARTAVQLENAAWSGA